MDFVYEFVVVRQNRNSKARYANGVHVGDRFKAILKLESTTGASNGLYALYVNIFQYVDGKLIHFVNLSQNEMMKAFTEKNHNTSAVFLVESV